jgi:hypothetical protein
MDSGFSMDTRHRASSDGQGEGPRTPLIDCTKVFVMTTAFCLLITSTTQPYSRIAIPQPCQPSVGGTIRPQTFRHCHPALRLAPLPVYRARLSARLPAYRDHLVGEPLALLSPPSRIDKTAGPIFGYHQSHSRYRLILHPGRLSHPTDQHLKHVRLRGPEGHLPVEVGSVCWRTLVPNVKKHVARSLVFMHAAPRLGLVFEEQWAAYPILSDARITNFSSTFGVRTFEFVATVPDRATLAASIVQRSTSAHWCSWGLPGNPDSQGTGTLRPIVPP